MPDFPSFGADDSPNHRMRVSVPPADPYPPVPPRELPSEPEDRPMPRLAETLAAPEPWAYEPAEPRVFFHRVSLTVEIDVAQSEPNSTRAVAMAVDALRETLGSRVIYDDGAFVLVPLRVARVHADSSVPL